MILAIDFDGVIHDKAHPVPGRRMGPPMPGAKAALEHLVAAGHIVIVHTVWGNTPTSRQVIGDWMRFYDLPLCEITSVKPNADVYLDDKAVRFTSWDAALAWMQIEIPSARVDPSAEEKEFLLQPRPGDPCTRIFGL